MARIGTTEDATRIQVITPTTKIDTEVAAGTLVIASTADSMLVLETEAATIRTLIGIIRVTKGGRILATATIRRGGTREGAITFEMVELDSVCGMTLGAVGAEALITAGTRFGFRRKIGRPVEQPLTGRITTSVEDGEVAKATTVITTSTGVPTEALMAGEGAKGVTTMVGITKITSSERTGADEDGGFLVGGPAVPTGSFEREVREAPEPAISIVPLADAVVAGKTEEAMTGAVMTMTAPVLLRTR